MPDLPDFLTRDNINDVLRRSDLGTLRRAARPPVGPPADIPPDAAARLVRHGLLLGSLHPGSRFRWLVSDRGLETLRADASCRDGSEPLTGADSAIRDALEALLDDEHDPSQPVTNPGTGVTRPTWLPAPLPPMPGELRPW